MLGRTSRRALVGLGLPLVLALTAGATLAQDLSEPYHSIKHPRVLVMTSGDTEVIDAARQALAYATTSVNFPTTFIDDPKLVDRQALSKFDVFVQFGPARMTPDQEKALWDFVNNGGGFLALHDAIDGPRGGLYEKIVGGSLLRRTDPYRIYVHVTEEGRKNPLNSGIRDFEIRERQIFPVYAVDPPAQSQQPPAAAPAGPNVRRVRRPGPAHVLVTGFAMDNTVDPERLKLRTNAIDNPIAGWWQEVGKGRSVYLSIGGAAAVMNHPTMQRMYENAFVWLGRER